MLCLRYWKVDSFVHDNFFSVPQDQVVLFYYLLSVNKLCTWCVYNTHFAICVCLFQAEPVEEKSLISSRSNVDRHCTALVSLLASLTTIECMQFVDNEKCSFICIS